VLTAATDPPNVAFWRTFRQAAWSNVEFSFDEDPSGHTTMVKGDRGFFGPVARFARSVDFAAGLIWAASRFVEAVVPDAYLLRVDWRDGAATAVSLYCRFPRTPDVAAFEAALATAWPLHWSGPAPHAVAAALGVAGPRGVGLRADAMGRERVALYFTVDGFAGDFESARLAGLVAAVGFADTVTEVIRADVRELFSEGPVGVIGIDPGREAAAGGLKLNPANVPVETAMAFLARKGAAPDRLEQLRQTARALRATSLSYVGVRYDAAGYAGWRVYLTVIPRRTSAPGLPAVAVDDPTPLPTLRLPHY
jgi:hypothetical protein